MFDIIRKTEYWQWLDDLDVLHGGEHSLVQDDLRKIQDHFVLAKLQGSEGKRILEVGGGKCRILPHLSKDNECWNADPMEGIGGGPKQVIETPGVRLVRAYLGDFSDQLPDEYFDVVFSISVVEHVPDVKLADFFRDGSRVLRSGGTMFHAIDFYMFDPENHDHPIAVTTRRRLELLLGMAEVGGVGLHLAKPPAIDPDIKFSCDFATNSDREMRLWNRFAPRLKATRAIAQSVSAKAEWRKTVSGPVSTSSSEQNASTAGSRVSISIISPSLNQARFLSKTLASVSAQRILPNEHLIFDAGSDDGSIDLLRDYEQQNEFARVQVAEDRGQADAINKGFAAATGDVITWLNTDDSYVDPDVLRDVAEVFDARPEVDMVYGRGLFVDPDGEVLREVWIQSEASRLPQTLQNSCGILQPALFLRRRLVAEAGLLDISLTCAFDYEYWIRLAKLGARFFFLDRPIAQAMVHADAKTSALRHPQLSQSIEAVERHYGYASAPWIRRLVELEDYGLAGILENERPNRDRDERAFSRHVRERFRQRNQANGALQCILQTPHEHGAATKEMAGDCGLIRLDRAVVTTFDAPYFEQGLTLIAGVHRTNATTLPIFIYDLGLTRQQRSILADLHLVCVLDYPAAVRTFFDGYMAPKNYAYKCAAMHDAKRYLPDGCLLLWVDAGVTPLRSLDPVFDCLAREGVFFVDHDDKVPWPFYNVTFTHSVALKKMGATTAEMLGEHLCSCLMGYRTGGPFERLFDDAYEASQVREVVVWDKHPPESERVLASEPDDREEFRTALLSSNGEAEIADLVRRFSYLGHRQDQSIYSILASRYGAPIQSATRYCRSNDESSIASKLNWESGSASTDVCASPDALDGMDATTVTYHHRGVFACFDGLRRACRRSDQAMVLGNGPSLRGFDFARLRDYDVIGMNAAYRYWDEVGRYPRYYICLDKVVGLSHRAEIARLIAESEENGIRYFCLRQNLIEELPELRSHPRVLNFDELRERCSTLAPMPITTGSHAALLLAVLGYTKIYLLGVDCNYVEELPGARKLGGTELELQVAPANNPNYFFDGYQRSGDRFNIPNPEPELHLNSWRAAANTLTAIDVRVWNLNRESKVDAFQFCDFDDLAEERSFDHHYRIIPSPRDLSESARTLLGPYERHEHTQLDEIGLIAHLLGHLPVGSTMVDVGAHVGTALRPFASRNWNVHAFEPDPSNRSRLLERTKAMPNVVVDERALGDGSENAAFLYASEESSGVSTMTPFLDSHREVCRVEVTSLAKAIEEKRIESIDFLKIDAEGHDLMVLRGFPWQQQRPRIILCEFEDRKTVPLGYTVDDMARFLVGRNYSVLVSEWHPVLRYGLKHDWRRLLPYPCRVHSESWGNLIAFRSAPVWTEVAEGAREFLHVPPLDPAAVPELHPNPPSAVPDGGESLRGVSEAARALERAIAERERVGGELAAVRDRIRTLERELSRTHRDRSFVGVPRRGDAASGDGVAAQATTLRESTERIRTFLAQVSSGVVDIHDR